MEGKDESLIILNNRVLDVVFIAWFIAQFYKVLTSIFKKRENRYNKTMGWCNAQVPRASTVSCLGTSIAIKYGIQPSFAITIIFAGIVMYVMLLGEGSRKTSWSHKFTYRKGTIIYWKGTV